MNKTQHLHCAKYEKARIIRLEKIQYNEWDRPDWLLSKQVTQEIRDNLFKDSVCFWRFEKIHIQKKKSKRIQKSGSVEDFFKIKNNAIKLSGMADYKKK